MAIEALSLNNGLELKQTLEDILTKPSDTLHTVGSYADLQEQGTSSPPSSPTADNDSAQAVPGLPPDLKCSLLFFVVFFFRTGILSSPHGVFSYFRLCFFTSPKTWKLLHSQLCSFPLCLFFFFLAFKVLLASFKFIKKITKILGVQPSYPRPFTIVACKTACMLQLYHPDLSLYTSSPQTQW